MNIFNSPRPRQGGMAVIVMLAFLTLLLIYIGANMHSLYRLDRELKLTEQRQIRRLNALSAQNAAMNTAETNAPPAIATPTEKTVP